MDFYLIKLTRFCQPWLVLNLQAGDHCMNWLRIGKWQLHLTYPRCDHKWDVYSTERAYIDMLELAKTEARLGWFAPKLPWLGRNRTKARCSKCQTWKIFKNDAAINIYRSKAICIREKYEK
jgi:glucose-6-phosphate dehydrogenase assembly protein OpcA